MSYNSQRPKYKNSREIYEIMEQHGFQKNKPIIVAISIDNFMGSKVSLGHKIQAILGSKNECQFISINPIPSHRNAHAIIQCHDIEVLKYLYEHLDGQRLSIDSQNNPFKGPRERAIQYSPPLNCHLLSSVSDLLIPSFDLGRLVIVDHIPATVEPVEIEDLVRDIAGIVMFDVPTTLAPMKGKSMYFMTEDTREACKISQKASVAMFMRITGVRVYSAENPQLDLCHYKGWKILREDKQCQSIVKPTIYTLDNYDDWDKPVNSPKRAKSGRDEDVLSLYATEALDGEVSQTPQMPTRASTSSQIQIKSKDGLSMFHHPFNLIGANNCQVVIDEVIQQSGERFTCRIDMVADPPVNVEFKLKAASTTIKNPMRGISKSPRVVDNNNNEASAVQVDKPAKPNDNESTSGEAQT
jgi:hypothetical protein